MPIEYDQAVNMFTALEDLQQQVAENARVINHNNEIHKTVLSNLITSIESLNKAIAHQQTVNGSMCELIKQVMDLNRLQADQIVHFTNMFELMISKNGTLQ